jgi:hypothetical protein
MALAAMRHDTEPETGIIHELYLDWNTTPPYAPHDVLVLDPPLPAVDTNIDALNQVDPNITLWK